MGKQIQPMLQKLRPSIMSSIFRFELDPSFFSFFSCYFSGKMLITEQSIQTYKTFEKGLEKEILLILCP